MENKITVTVNKFLNNLTMPHLEKKDKTHDRIFGVSIDNYSKYLNVYLNVVIFQQGLNEPHPF